MSIKWLAAPLATLGFLVAVAPAQAADITVFNTNNGGAGSLRSAMLSAEMDAARDTIKFGVRIVRSNDNTIEDNVISANAGDGVSIEADGANGNRLARNWIGTDATGTLELGNEGDGVRIDGGDLNHTVDANTIAHNDANGVTVVSGEMNAILENSIYDNGDLAIDLGDDGATANDALDVDVGANNFQNHPVVTSATATSVDWTLDADPDDVYRLEFYAGDGCPVGSGEGETYLGSIDVWTDANGHAEGSRPAPVAGRQVSMTATRMALVAQLPFPRSTSEFSPCVQAP